VIADVMRWSRALVLEDFRVVDFTESVPPLSSAPAFLATADSLAFELMTRGPMLG
jgi:hypothetical protein